MFGSDDGHTTHGILSKELLGELKNYEGDRAEPLHSLKYFRKMYLDSNKKVLPWMYSPELLTWSAKQLSWGVNRITRDTAKEHFFITNVYISFLSFSVCLKRNFALYAQPELSIQGVL